MPRGSVIPLVKTNPRALAKASHDELVDLYSHYRKMGNEWLRRAIVENDRIDILAGAVLGYEVQPFHLAMMQFQFLHPQSIILCYRGSGKTIICTITKAIHLLVKNRNLRILFASKTSGNAGGFLKEVKGHFEQSARLIEIFGEFYDPRKCEKWDKAEIEVVGRTHWSKESSITCAGIEGTIVSKHYDVIFSDDLLDEDNARTKLMRDKTKTWFYQTLDPCLEPPDSNVQHRGEHHVLGTRYHYADLYGHLIGNEMSDHHLIIKAVDEKGLTPWPEKHSPSWFEEKKKGGTIIFNCQYQNDTEAMKGEFFEYDDCQIINDKDIPDSLRIFLGTDLAISKDAESAEFAIVVIGLDREGRVFVLDFYLGRLSFPKQIKKGNEFYDRHDPIRAGVESNAYQDAFRQQQKEVSKDDGKNRRWVGTHTSKDKVTRAMKLQPLFEGGRVFFRRGMDKLTDQFVLFPGYPLRDGLDAFDIAYRVSQKKKKKRRRRKREPGLI